MSFVAGQHKPVTAGHAARSGCRSYARGCAAAPLCLHRYNIAADLVEELLPDLRSAAASAPESLTWPPPPNSHGQGVAAMAGLVAVTVWLRFSSLRLLTWNHNYNVKPREISAALDRLGANLVQVGAAQAHHHNLRTLANHEAHIELHRLLEGMGLLISNLELVVYCVRFHALACRYTRLAHSCQAWCCSRCHLPGVAVRVTWVSASGMRSWQFSRGTTAR